jgi:hypothetical protein
MNALTQNCCHRGILLIRAAILAMLLNIVTHHSANAGDPPPVAARLRAHIPQPPPAATPVAPAPRYLLLQGALGGVGQTVRGTPYAYGWFGAGPRGHSEFARGYYGETRIMKIRQ